MVGNDEYTRSFREFWESSAKPPGSKLVYSTGRSLESFTKLIETKSQVMVEPDGLICAVGTKVFQPSGDVSRPWVEDAEWTAALTSTGAVMSLRRRHEERSMRAAMTMRTFDLQMNRTDTKSRWE